RGADVELWYGNVSADIPEWIPNKEFDSLNDLLEMINELEGTVVVPAALSDFGVEEVAESKISSRESLNLELTPMPKFIDEIRDQVDYLVAYKATDTRQKAVEKAKKMREEDRADMVVANSLKDVSEDENSVYILGDGTWVEGSKRSIADYILDELEKELK
ncbi:MAG: phosphopantothenoylcysteine decarboxylase, partial [Thermoplasmatota archaeon]